MLTDAEIKDLESKGFTFLGRKKLQRIKKSFFFIIPKKIIREQGLEYFTPGEEKPEVELFMFTEKPTKRRYLTIPLPDNR